MSKRFRIRLLLGLGLILAGGGLLFWYLRPDPHLAAAEQALARHDYAAAYALVEDSLARRPDDPRLLLLAGRTARRAERFEQAAKHLNAYRRLKGENPSLTLEWSLLRLQQGDGSVEAYLRKRAEGGGPDALLIWEILSQYYLDGYRLFEARDCLDRYLEQRPDDVFALLGRGVIWERLLHFPEAVRDYRRAVQAEPDNELARFRLAENLTITGPSEEAAEQYEWLRRRRTEDAAVQLGLARAWRQMGRIEEARQLLDNILRRHPQRAAALTERGRLDREAGQLQQAADWLRRAVDLAPHDREALYNLWLCLKECGPEEEARQCYKRFERADADLKRLGFLAKEVLRQPRDPALRSEGGLLFLRNHQEEEGVRWLLQALRLDPEYRPAHQALADYYQRKGKPELATRHRQRVETQGRRP